MSSEVCQDKIMNGVCSKGKDCEICNKQKQGEKKKQIITADELNCNAPEFVPKRKKEKKEENKKLEFNLDAKEYIPKRPQNNKENDNDEDSDEENEKAIEEYENRLVEEDLMAELDEDDSEDEDKWYPKYQNCECCKGFVYKCKGEACQNLGQCFCKMKDDCDDIEEN